MSWFCANGCGHQFPSDHPNPRVCDACRANKRTQLVLDLVGIREGESIIAPEIEQQIVDGWLIMRDMEAIDRAELMNLRAHNKLLEERVAALEAVDWCGEDGEMCSADCGGTIDMLRRHIDRLDRENHKLAQIRRTPEGWCDTEPCPALLDALTQRDEARQQLADYMADHQDVTKADGQRMEQLARERDAALSQLECWNCDAVGDWVCTCDACVVRVAEYTEHPHDLAQVEGVIQRLTQERDEAREWASKLRERHWKAGVFPWEQGWDHDGSGDVNSAEEVVALADQKEAERIEALLADIDRRRHAILDESFGTGRSPTDEEQAELDRLGDWMDELTALEASRSQAHLRIMRDAARAVAERVTAATRLTRVVVVDHRHTADPYGIAFSTGIDPEMSVSTSVQDEGRTLKVFLGGGQMSAFDCDPRGIRVRGLVTALERGGVIEDEEE